MPPADVSAPACSKSCSVRTRWFRFAVTKGTHGAFSATHRTGVGPLPLRRRQVAAGQHRGQRACHVRQRRFLLGRLDGLPHLVSDVDVGALRRWNAWVNRLGNRHGEARELAANVAKNLARMAARNPVVETTNARRESTARRLLQLQLKFGVVRILGEWAAERRPRRGWWPPSPLESWDRSERSTARAGLSGVPGRLSSNLASCEGDHLGLVQLLFGLLASWR